MHVLVEPNYLQEAGGWVQTVMTAAYAGRSRFGVLGRKILHRVRQRRPDSIPRHALSVMLTSRHPSSSTDPAARQPGRGQRQGQSDSQGYGAADTGGRCLHGGLPRCVTRPVRVPSHVVKLIRAQRQRIDCMPRRLFGIAISHTSEYLHGHVRRGSAKDPVSSLQHQATGWCTKS
jgi:hypothetical protein